MSRAPRASCAVGRGGSGEVVSLFSPSGIPDVPAFPPSVIPDVGCRESILLFPCPFSRPTINLLRMDSAPPPFSFHQTPSTRNDGNQDGFPTKDVGNDGGGQKTSCRHLLLLSRPPSVLSFPHFPLSVIPDVGNRESILLFPCLRLNQGERQQKDGFPNENVGNDGGGVPLTSYGWIPRADVPPAIGRRRRGMTEIRMDSRLRTSGMTEGDGA